MRNINKVISSVTDKKRKFRFFWKLMDINEDNLDKYEFWADLLIYVTSNVIFILVTILVLIAFLKAPNKVNVEA